MVPSQRGAETQEPEQIPQQVLAWGFQLLLQCSSVSSRFKDNH